MHFLILKDDSFRYNNNKSDKVKQSLISNYNESNNNIR